jgi:hypothetical protein
MLFGWWVTHKPRKYNSIWKKREICYAKCLRLLTTITKNFTGLFFNLNEGKVVSVEEYLMGYDDKYYIKCCRKNVINMDEKIIRPQN